MRAFSAKKGGHAVYGIDNVSGSTCGFLTLRRNPILTVFGLFPKFSPHIRFVIEQSRIRLLLFCLMSQNRSYGFGALSVRRNSWT
jgi:hypothetical protein